MLSIGETPESEKKWTLGNYQGFPFSIIEYNSSLVSTVDISWDLIQPPGDIKKIEQEILELYNENKSETFSVIK